MVLRDQSRSSSCTVGSATCRMDPELLEWRWKKEKSLHMKHTQETKFQAMLFDCWNKLLFAAESTMIHSPEFWSVGHLVTKTQTSRLSWKTQVCGTTVRENAAPKDAVLQTIMNFSMRSEDEKHITNGARLSGVRAWNQRQSWSETHD